jgi:hypothetical protein
MLKEPLALRCIGGFVICYFYGLPRTTGDIDYYSAVPANLNLVDIAGEGSALAIKYKIRLHHVAVMTMPEDHETRLTEMFPGMFEQMRLFAPDPYDYICQSWSGTVRKTETTLTISSERRGSIPRPSGRGINRNSAHT